MKDVIIALDFPDRAKTLGFLDRFTDRKPFVKVGMELFYAEGHSLVEEIKRRGHNIFLDLKLHDIPNTVGSAMKVIGGLGVDMVNVHAAGGRAMMKAAAEGLALSGHKTILIAVTQLTSTSQEMLENELLISKPIEEVIAHYARNAKAAGLSGVVCSPLEAAIVKEACGSDFIAVTPGIRFADGDSNDQVRITTPADARRRGADFIVVGRPITKAEDPVVAYQRCVADFWG